MESVRQRIDSSKTTLVAADRPLGAVRIVDRDEAIRAFATIHAEVASLRHGTLHRSDPFAEYYLHDYSWEREGHTKPRFALYEGDDGNGYVVFRMKGESPGAVRFEEMFVTSLAARRALLEFGLGFDLRRDLVLWGRPGDDPVRWMLTNPYAMKTEDWDYVWYRLVDLEAALVARHYESDGSIVLEVADEQLDHNNGIWKIEIAGGQASVERTAELPHHPDRSPRRPVHGRATSVGNRRGGRDCWRRDQPCRTRQAVSYNHRPVDGRRVLDTARVQNKVSASRRFENRNRSCSFGNYTYVVFLGHDECANTPRGTPACGSHPGPTRSAGQSGGFGHRSLGARRV